MDTTPDMVWENVLKDSMFAAKDLAEQTALEPFIRKLPEILKPHMQRKVTVKSLSEARMAYSNYALKHGLIDAIVPVFEAIMASMPLLGLFGGSVSSLVVGLMDSREELMNGLVGSTSETLKALGLSKDEFMRSQYGDLNEKALEEYEKGELTIGRLLEIDPCTFCGVRQTYQ